MGLSTFDRLIASHEAEARLRKQIWDRSLAPEVNIARGGCLVSLTRTSTSIRCRSQHPAAASPSNAPRLDGYTYRSGTDRIGSLTLVVMSVRNVTYDDFDPVIVYSNPADWSTPNPQASLSPFTNIMKRDSRWVSILCSSCNRTIPAGSMLRPMSPGRSGTRLRTTRQKSLVPRSRSTLQVSFALQLADEAALC